ncbi:carbon-nitrogen hydrolase family protein [Pelagibius sp.]|uniref:carbon-nitrogen hydrolase family protein n=1 Tax=Pelagibius sp. TaxID=1931238 RepID=UPI00260363F0|nr:carbon-nitrogen hydrolase family protein [Pelagibius sp.]
MTPPRLTVATAQFALTARPLINAKRMAALIHRSAEAGAQVAHFPECALSGYPRQQLESWQGYDWTALEVAQDLVAQACRDAGLWAVYGSAQPLADAALPHNSVFVVAPDGQACGRYDKRCCSLRELDYFTPGGGPAIIEIAGLRCGVLLCLEWSFPELWRAYADAGVELVFLSAYAAGLQGRHLHSDVIPPVLQGHAFTNSLFISTSNACNPSQAFASHWVKRSGRRGSACRRHRPGLTVNAVADDPEKDAVYRRIRAFRAEASSGRLYRNLQRSEAKLKDE